MLSDPEVACLRMYCALVGQLGKASSYDALYHQLASERQWGSKSTIRKNLEELERWRGDKPLFEKRENVLVLTAEGSNLYNNARELLRHYSMLIGNQPRRTRIDVGVGMTLCTSHMPAIWARCQKELPDIDVRLEYGTNMGLHESVLKGELHFAIVGLPDSSADRDDNIVGQFKFEPVIIAHREHPIAIDFRNRGLNAFDWSQLAGHTLLVPETRLPSIELPKEVRDRRDVNLLAQPSIATVNAMVAAGGSVGLTLHRFLTPEQQGLVQVMRYEGAQEVRFVIREALSRQRLLTKDELHYHARFRAILLEEMGKIQDAGPSRASEYFAPDWQAYFAQRAGEGLEWVKGGVHLCFYPGDRFVGQFSFERHKKETTDEYKYQLEGYATRHARQDQFNLVACGQEIRRTYGSQFIFSCITTFKGARRGPIVAHWSGALDKGDQGFHPQRGVIVLYAQDFGHTSVEMAQRDYAEWGKTNLQESTFAISLAANPLADGARAAVAAAAPVSAAVPAGKSGKRQRGTQEIKTKKPR